MGPDKPGDADDRPLIGSDDVGHSASQSPAGCEHIAFAYDEDEDGVELSLEDENLVRTAFAAALAEVIGDKGLSDAPSRSRQDRTQLVEVMQTDLHGREIEELHFIAMSFGLSATIELEPMMPEGHDGRVMVSLTSTGRSFV